MTGEPIPQNDHIARIIKNTDYNETDGVSSSAFLLNGHTDGISANWIEILRLPHAEALKEVLRAASAKRQIKPNQRMAILNVGDIIQKVRVAVGLDLKAVHAPEAPPEHLHIDESHSLVFVEPVISHAASDQLIAELLVSCISSPCQLVREL